MFIIAQHREKLKPTGKKDRYFCPVCGGNDFTIDPKRETVYQCWHGCEDKDIREALSPWQDYRLSDRVYSDRHIYSKKPQAKNQLPPIDKEKIELAKLPAAATFPEIISNPKIDSYLTRNFEIPQKCDRLIKYQYSSNQWVYRYEWADTTREKGYDKKTLPYHLNEKKQHQIGKGKSDWSAYRLEEAIAHSKNKLVLLVEGESSVEAARKLGLIAITFQGGSWSKNQIEKELKKLQEAQIAGLIIFPDHDQAGRKKANLVQEICTSLNFPSIKLNPLDIWESMPEKGDIVDWVIANKELGKDQMVKQLESATLKALEDVEAKEPTNIIDFPIAKSSKKKTNKQLIDYLRDKYRDRLKLNKLQQRIELDGEEFLIEEAYLLLAEEEDIDCSKAKAADIFQRLAKENSYNPVEDYLDRVMKSVNPINLDNLSQRYFGTANPIYDIFLKKTLIAAVARIYEPGCKHDTALVLQGTQGAGKSSFFDALGGEWFDDSMGSVSNKDDLLILHKSWIQEWGEIERTFSRKQSEEIKAFLSRRKDLLRPPYGRSTLEFPRRSIIVGSCNSSEFLLDNTGSRRFWIIPVANRKINISQLKAERDGIWAAAVLAYRSNQKWWLTDEEELMSQQNNQQFQIVDEWQAAIAEYLESRDKVSITEVLTKLFDFEVGKIDKRSQMRISNILTALKWRKTGQQQHLGKRQIVWIPATPTTPDQEVLQEVLQPETMVYQESATPTIPTTPFSETLEKEKEEEYLEQSFPPSESKKEKVEQLGIEGVAGIAELTPARFSGCNTPTTPPATPPTICSKLKVGDRVKIKGSKVTGTLLEFFQPDNWTIKNDPGFSTPFESKPECLLELIRN